MSNEAAVLVLGNLPATPLTLIDSGFMTDLALSEAHVGSLKITDAKSAQEASRLLSSLTSAGTRLESERKKVKQPFKDICDAIDAAPKPIAFRIEQAKTVLRGKLTAHQEAEAKAAAERERIRLAEIARLQKIKDEEDRKLREEAERLAAEIEANRKAGQRVIDDPDFDMEPAPKSETEIALERAQFSPVVAPVKPAGVAFRCTLRIKSTQISALPDHFVVKTADEVALRRTYCVPWKEGQPLPVCPGVVFEIDRTPVSTGRGF